MDTSNEIACAVLGCPSTGELRLIDLDRDEVSVPDAEAAKMRESGMYFVGVATFNEGIIDAACDDPRDAALMLSACAEFSRYVSGRDGVDWLKQLWSLPDTREN